MASFERMKRCARTRYSKPFQPAFERGWKDQENGVAFNDCPYRRARNNNSGFKQAHVNAWQDGWRTARAL